MVVAVEPEVLSAVVDAVEALPAYDAAATYVMPNTATVAPVTAPKVSRRRRRSPRSRSVDVKDFISTCCAPPPCKSVMHGLEKREEELSVQ